MENEINWKEVLLIILGVAMLWWCWDETELGRVERLRRVEAELERLRTAR